MKWEERVARQGEGSRSALALFAQLFTQFSNSSSGTLRC